MLDVTFLVDVVERDELIAKEPQCWQLVNRAKNYHLLPQRVIGPPVNTAASVVPSTAAQNMSGGNGALTATASPVATSSE